MVEDSLDFNIEYMLAYKEKKNLFSLRFHKMHIILYKTTPKSADYASQYIVNCNCIIVKKNLIVNFDQL